MAKYTMAISGESTRLKKLGNATSKVTSSQQRKPCTYNTLYTYNIYICVCVCMYIDIHTFIYILYCIFFVGFCLNKYGISYDEQTKWGLNQQTSGFSQQKNWISMM